jgi:hypothetical protein
MARIQAQRAAAQRRRKDILVTYMPVMSVVSTDIRN